MSLQEDPIKDEKEKDEIVSSTGYTELDQDSILSNKGKSNRPEDSDWAQQRLSLWQPMLTLRIAIINLFSIGLVIFGFGLVITIQSTNLDIYRVVYDGTDAISNQDDGIVSQVENCILSNENQANSFSSDHTCFINITLENDISKRAHIYYELSNYYQNHRRFVTSLVPGQFLDSWHPGDSLSSCEPVLKATSNICNGSECSGPIEERDLFPCGIIANTMFNDIIWLDSGILPNGEILGREDLTQTGIARNYLNNEIKNPSIDLNDSYLPLWHNPNYSRIIPVPGQSNDPVITDDYTNNTAWVNKPPGEGLENEHFRVWIDLAAHSRFRKPYGKIERSLPAGTILRFAVQSNFYVRPFDGTKALIVARISWFGSENVELGIVFILVGLLCLFFGAFFLYRQWTNPRKLGDASVMQWKFYEKNK